MRASSVSLADRKRLRALNDAGEETTAEVAHRGGTGDVPTANRPRLGRVAEAGRVPVGGVIETWAAGLNVLLDEVVVSAQEFSPAPRYLSIALTNACELRCAYCYAPK